MFIWSNICLSKFVTVNWNFNLHIWLLICWSNFWSVDLTFDLNFWPVDQNFHLFISFFYVNLNLICNLFFLSVDKVFFFIRRKKITYKNFQRSLPPQNTKWPSGCPKWPTESNKGSIPKLIGTQIKFCKISFFIEQLFCGKNCDGEWKKWNEWGTRMFSFKKTLIILLAKSVTNFSRLTNLLNQEVKNIW